MKILLKIALGLVLLLIAVPLAIALLLDPNDFKTEIQDRVARATGRELTLDGDLGLSLFPWVGLEIREASLSQPPGFGAGPFAQIEEARVRARLLPLLFGRIELAVVTGRGLRLHLIRLADGRANWQVWGGPQIGPGTATIPPPSRSGPGSPPPLAGGSASEDAAAPLPTTEQAQAVQLPPPEHRTPARLPEPHAAVPGRRSADAGFRDPGPVSGAAFRVGGVDFEDVRIDWDDRQTGAHLVFGDMSLSTGPVSLGEPVDIRLASHIAEEAWGIAGGLILLGQATLATGGNRLTLAPFQLRLEDLTTVPGLAAAGSLTGELEADFDAGRYRLSGLALGLDATGGPIGGEPVRVEGEAGLLLDLLAGTLELEDLKLASGELLVQADASGQGLRHRPAFSGRLALDEIDLRAWLERHGLPIPPTTSLATFTRVALQSDWRAGDGRLDLQDLRLILDRTRVTGSAALIATAPLGYRFDLDADRLDLDDYLPPRSRRGSGSPGPGGPPDIPPPSGDRSAAPATAMAAPRLIQTAAPPSRVRTEPAWRFIRVRQAPRGSGRFPLRLIRGLDLAGQARIEALRVYGLTLGGVEADIEAFEGRVRVDERVSRFYGGRLDGHAGLRADLDTPRLVLVQRGEDVQAGPLLGDLIGEALVTGQGRFEADLSAVGQTPDALRRSLSGEADIELAMGSIKGFNLEQVIRRAEARLKGKPAPSAEPERTDFTQLRASARIDQGVLTNRDLFATSSYIHARGSGTLRLADWGIDYRLEPWFVDPPKGRGIKEIEDIPIPIRITGTLQDPDWSVDIGPVLREVAQRRLGEGLDLGEKLRELEERIDLKGLEEGLRRLLDF
jgi:AsmA protein